MQSILTYNLFLTVVFRNSKTKAIGFLLRYIKLVLLT